MPAIFFVKMMISSIHPEIKIAKTRDGRRINMTILFSAIPKDILIYLDQMFIELSKHVELKT